MPEAESSRKQSGPADDPLVGRVLNGRFTIVAPLGAGGMGKVYRAIQQPLDRVVALKVLNPNFANSKDPGFVKRFVLEASMTSKLRHPNTVTVIDYGQTEDGILFLAMEFLEGRTLADMLAATGPLPWNRAVGIGQQVCRSLREAHKCGIVHRDLKPANVMLLDEADSDVIKVLDFGLVKSFITESEGPIDAKITQTGMLLGSPQYMAPEQAKNQGDPRSDIYSFGVLLYEMVCGHPPFQGKDYLEVIVRHIKDVPPSFTEIRPDLDVPAPVEAVVMRCLQKDPASRFQSMDEVLDALRVLAGAQPGQSSSFKAISQTGKWGVPQALPPPLPGGRGLATPSPSQAFGPATPVPFGGLDPTGAHTRSPSGQFQQLVQTSYPTPPPMQQPALFASETGRHPVVMPPPDATLPVGAPLFASEAPKKKGGAVWIIAGLSVAALGGSYWLFTRESKPIAPQPQAQAQPAPKPEEKPAAAPAETAKKNVRFKVSSEPTGAQVFMGARDLGQTPTAFELPAGEDGTATAELVLILDGYHPLAVSAGGSGDVLIRQTLQRKMRGERERLVRVGSSRPVSHDIDAPEIVAPPDVSAAPAPAPARNDSAPKPTPEVTPPPAATAPVPAAAPATSLAVVQATVGSKDSTGVEILPFGEGMTKPEVLKGVKEPEYPREAYAAKIEGLMIVKCVINTNGRLERCRTIKSLPFMEEPVVSWLQSRLYKPVTYQGRPVAVDYVFTVRLVAPKR